jgi:curved DNA-binding protein CbpA
MESDSGSDPGPVEEASRDLSENQRNRINTLYQRLGKIDYFTLLEVSPCASATEIKRAYFTLSKEFHPDRWHNKELGPFRERLVAVFKALSRGYKHLSDDKHRTEYVRSLAEQRDGPITPLPREGSEVAVKVAKRRSAGPSPADLAWAQATGEALPIDPFAPPACDSVVRGVEEPARDAAAVPADEQRLQREARAGRDRARRDERLRLGTAGVWARRPAHAG